MKIVKKECYTLQYETREGSEEFLKAIDLERRDENIDYFHMCDAYETIKEWFDNQDGTYRIKFLQTLLNDDDTGKNVKVIWYEIKENIDPVEVFTRLNIGKIPLTNAELVKALFLRSQNFSTNEVSLQQIKIAQEWDTIEKALQDDEFWYFLNNEDKYATRIEYLLELMANDFDCAEDAAHDPYYTFIAFNRQIADNGLSPAEGWEKIKQFYMQLEEWYRDRFLFHMVGFLVNQGVGIPELINMSASETTKQGFRASMRERVFRVLFRIQNLSNYPAQEDLQAFIEEELNDWNYNNNAIRIHTALLLFNIASLLRNSKTNMRFQFDSYKKDKWDLEHVRSVKSDKPSRIDDQKEWLNNILIYFTGVNDSANQEIALNEIYPRRIRVLCEFALKAKNTKPFDELLFDRIYYALLKYFKENVGRETDDSIGNLALLDASTNRSYKNAVFPIKRKRILAFDKEGTFVPLCTKNVFLKYYSDRIENMMFWTEQDRTDYFDAIIEMLVWFFTDECEGAQ